MRILFVCVPRTGSNSFIKALSKSLNINYISIPDNFNLNENKSLIDSVLSKDDIIFRMSPINDVGYSLLQFTSFFDEVILVSRLNEKEHYQSLVNLYYRENILKFGTKAAYDYNDIPPTVLTQIEKVVDYDEIDTQKKQIEELSLVLKEKVLYYEDIFNSDDVVNYLDLKFDTFDKDKYTFYLSQTKKYRITRERLLI